MQDCEASIMAFDLSRAAVSASRERAESVLVVAVGKGGVTEDGPYLDSRGRLPARSGPRHARSRRRGRIRGRQPTLRAPRSHRPGGRGIYRKRYETMIGRADLYVGFFERALEMLAPGGVCAFICADRWMLNQYGSRLRKLITSGGFSVEAVVEMHRADAFQDEVLAYPAITSIRRTDKQGKVLVARLDRDSSSVSALPEAAQRVRSENPTVLTRRCPGNARGGRRMVLRRGSLALRFPRSFEVPQTFRSRVPAARRSRYGYEGRYRGRHGADKIFLTKDPRLVEESRLLPLALAKDTMNGVLEWSGHYLVNPWEADGSLVDLELYPGLRRYFEITRPSSKSST